MFTKALAMVKNVFPHSPSGNCSQFFSIFDQNNADTVADGLPVDTTK